jgi:hypothetical protein
MMNNTTVIGHRVQISRGVFVNQYGESVYSEPEACNISEAYRRISVYLSRNPGTSVPTVVDVTRTPMETASRELGSLLTSLCQRHGLNLGLSQDQIERQISKELADLGATGVGILGQIRR